LEIWNAELKKFYREKKPRHFFYTIEYPYPPTNSVGNGRKIFLPIRALRRPMTRTMNMSRVSYRDSTSSITPMVSCTFIQIVFSINYTE
jgi:hypothetical protein